MHKKRRQRSVGTQSADIHDTENEASLQTARLCKKAGFRNLLQKSVTVVTQDKDEGPQRSSVPRQVSKSIQASLDLDEHFQKPRVKSGGHSEEFSISKKDEESRPPSAMLRVVDRPTGKSIPGTSGMSSTAFSSYSILSEVDNLYKKPREGSLAVVYSYGEKGLQTSRSSNLGYYYGSQIYVPESLWVDRYRFGENQINGSRRFSDETVLLIEDYQSYDYNNAARRQEMDFAQRRGIMCCNRSKRSSAEFLTRPIPLEFEDIAEKDELTVCRICHEGEDVEPLIEPCLCKVSFFSVFLFWESQFFVFYACLGLQGSVGSVHASCLKIWLEQSNTSRCELCNYPYAVRQTKKYRKCISIKVFFKTIVDRRSMAYDVISFVIITPLTLVGVAMCIQASIFSGESGGASTYKMGNITRAGMIMLSATIVVAYAVWLYTLISYYFKSWKKWYANCYDVEVIPVRMTSEERLEAARRLSEEMDRRQHSREQGSALITVLNSPNNYSFYQRRLSVPPPPPPLAPVANVHR